MNVLVLLSVLAVVVGAWVPGSAAQRRPSFPSAYTASFSRSTSFSNDGFPSIVIKDGTYTQSAQLNSSKSTGIIAGEFEIDATELYLYNQHVAYSWLTYWGLCSRRALTAYDTYWDPLFGVQLTSYTGLTKMKNGQVAQLWTYAQVNLTWEFYVTNDANQYPLRVFVNASSSGYDIEFTSFKPGVSPDAFKPAGSCSWMLFEDDGANGNAVAKQGSERRSDETGIAGNLSPSLSARRGQLTPFLLSSA